MTTLERLIGVNFHGYGSSVYQNRNTPKPPENYVNDSFAIFSRYGMTCVRVTLYWESWELNKNQFKEDLLAIGQAS